MNSVDWSTILDGIYDWVKALSGLADGQIIWSDQRGPQPPSGTYIELDIHETKTVGGGWIITEDNPALTPGAEILHKVRGVVSATLVIQCFGHGTNVREAKPQERLEDIVRGRRLPSVRLALSKAKIGIGPIQPVQNIAYERSKLFEPRARVEIALSLVSELVEAGTYIETVETTRRIASVDTVDFVFGVGAAVRAATLVALSGLAVTGELQHVRALAMLATAGIDVTDWTINP